MQGSKYAQDRYYLPGEKLPFDRSDRNSELG